MKHLFEAAVVEETKARILSLKATSTRQWGRMGAAQALAHCAVGLESAVGDRRPPRVFIGRFVGPLIKRLAIGDERPFRRNSPTSPEFVIADPRDLAQEQARLCALLDRFAAGGASACTTHPHSFFGPLAPHEWAVLMYKHLDHHLRQFGV